MDADLDDPAVLIELVTDHGPLIRDANFQWTSDEHGSLPLCGMWLSGADGANPAILCGATRANAVPVADYDAWDSKGGYRTHLLGLRYRLKLARTLLRHWLFDLEDRAVEEAWLHEMGVVPEHPWATFSRELSDGLFDFRVRAEWTWTVEGEELSETRPQPDLYAAVCLQLFNLIVENLPVRHCASETCQRAFFRQVGRAEHGQYRKEGVVRYCSPNCANAQTQRDYRRRKRAEKRDAR